MKTIEATFIFFTYRQRFFQKHDIHQKKRSYVSHKVLLVTVYCTRNLFPIKQIYNSLEELCNQVLVMVKGKYSSTFYPCGDTAATAELTPAWCLLVLPAQASCSTDAQPGPICPPKPNKNALSGKRPFLKDSNHFILF